MTVEAIIATVAELGEEHAPLTIRERDGVDIVRCEACGHAVVVGA
jgi:Zn ribbon nucleic-acid-binding protein